MLWALQRCCRRVCTSLALLKGRGRGWWSCRQVYAMYFGLLLSVLARLPLKLPQRGAGRRHGGAAPAAAVTFDDVAGVDEAKEELAEVVVRAQSTTRALLFASVPSRSDAA